MVFCKLGYKSWLKELTVTWDTEVSIMLVIPWIIYVWNPSTLFFFLPFCVSLEGLILWFELLLYSFSRIVLRFFFCFFLVDMWLHLLLARVMCYIFSDIPARDFDGIHLQYIANQTIASHACSFLKFYVHRILVSHIAFVYKSFPIKSYTL